MNWVKSICQFPVLFWTSSLSLGIHGLALMVPVEIEPKQPKVPPLQTISLIPLPQERNPPNSQISPNSQIQTPPTPIVSPPASPISQPSNLQESPPTESQEVRPSTSKVTPTTKPIDQKPIKQDPTPSETSNPTPKPSEIESPEQFAMRTQTAFTQVTGRIGQQYGDRFAERSETIAASPELFFTQPKLFYDGQGKPLPGFDGKPFQIEKETPEQAFKVFETNFKTSGFTVLALENYGGGLLYEVKSKKEGNPEKVAFYINLLLIPDKSGTIVVIWSQRPQQ